METRSYKDERIREYLMPISVVEKSENVVGEECLTGSFLMQHVMEDLEYCECRGKGYIILDFGREYFGSVRLLFSAIQTPITKPAVRIRFGESLTECCSEIGEKNSTNDHSTRDMSICLTGNSDTEWGMTAYRFIRIDFLEEGMICRLARVYGVYIHTQPPKGRFHCDNELVNQIFDTAAHTLHLNMQNCVWDGIKRDQHVWAGDMYPEILGILYLYGDCREIRNSFETIIRHYTNKWYNNIPTYNFWFLLTLKEYFAKTGNVNPEYMSAAIENLRLIEKCVNEDGTLSVDKAGLYCSHKDFFDWPSYGTKDGAFACYALAYYTLREVASCGYFSKEIRLLAETLAERLAKREKEISCFKAITAMGLLVEKCEKESAIAFLREGGAKGYSAFLSYFISKALAENGYLQEAYENNLQYYGGMLKMGATSFWEGFDVDWTENACKITERPKAGQKDIHGDFGKDCYVGFRHSLCHGWSCGVLPFFVEYIVGFRFSNDDCTKITLNPQLCGLKHVECEIPTAKGLVKITCDFDNGEICKRVELPEGISLG
ncbi:MAG: hypothetical protein E7380_04365 [Clostridiales bacterium]|nr:hypothetical protein [Clostridiales bacterium]